MHASRDLECSQSLVRVGWDGNRTCPGRSSRRKEKANGHTKSAVPCSSERRSIPGNLFEPDMRQCYVTCFLEFYRVRDITSSKNRRDCCACYGSCVGTDFAWIALCEAYSFASNG